MAEKTCMEQIPENVEKPKRSPGRIIARNTAFGFVAQIALRAVSFLFGVLIVHRLGTAEYGQYNVVLAWTGLFSVLGDLGISQYFGREIARNPEKTNELFWDMVVLRGLLALVASSVTTFGAIAYPYPSEIVLAIFLYTLTYFLQAFLAPLQAVLAGNERLDITSAFDVLGQIIFIIAGAIFLFISKDFIWLIVAAFINIPVLIYLCYRMVRRNNLGPPRFHLNRGLWWTIIKAGLPFGFIQLALSFSFRVDTIILSKFVSNAEIGWYNIAYGLTLTFMTLTRAFNFAILPTLAREHAQEPKKVLPWYYRSVKMMLFIGLPLAVGGMLLADPIITTIYGAENQVAYLSFFIIIWDLPIVMYTAFCGNMTTSIRRETGAAKIYISQGIINVIINLVLIPRFGMIGSSFATVLTDLAGAFLFYFLFRREFGSGLGLKYLLRLALSAALMGIIVFILDRVGIHFILVIPIAMVAYLGLVWGTRSFTPDERQQLMSIVHRITRRFQPQPTA